jgi:ribonuclease VapC
VSTCVLDASALLALLHAEPGADAVQDAVDEAAISTVNWSEVQQRWIGHGVDPRGLRADVEALGLELVAFTADDAEYAADLWPRTRRLGLSLGDRACLALAHRLGLLALTADRSWLRVKLDVEVQPIR